MTTDATARPSFRNQVTGKVIDPPAVDVLTEMAKATDARSRPGRSVAR